ncbi:MAG TPA: DUF308 domain-containing protein [Pyrinomonadaceae bacterium]|nr:DUF308 domain-containing protein [Pyrinomonadaceae bacterium]
MKEEILDLVNKTAGASIAVAVIMIILGCIAIAMPYITGMTFSIFFGWLILITGFFHFIDAFTAGGVGGVLWRLLVSIAYLLGGVYLIINPGLALDGLTFAIAFVFVVEGILRIIASIGFWKLPGSGWALFDGIISIALGVMIGYSWPESSVWVLGTIIGVNLLVSGFTRLMVSAAVKGAVKPAAG